MPRWVAKSLALGPGLIISTAVTSMVGAALPPVGGAVLFFGGLLTALLLVLGAGEPLAARVLLISRPARDHELELVAGALTLMCRAGLGPPLVRLHVRAGEHSIGAAAFGRRTVVVSQGLLEAVEDGSLPQDQAAAVMAHAAGLVRTGWVRHDPVLGFWSLPWQMLRAVGQAVAGVGRRLPLTSTVWRLRAVVILIAVVQAMQARQGWLAVTIAGIGAVSYGMPVWERKWQRMLRLGGDDAVREASLAVPMAAFLRRCPRTPTVRERLRGLEPDAPSSRPVGLVR